MNRIIYTQAQLSLPPTSTEHSFLTVENVTEALTDFPLEKAVVLPLHFSNDIPDTCHPVCKESKHGHEQGEDDCAVLRITVQLLQEAQKAQQPYSLQEMNQ